MGAANHWADHETRVSEVIAAAIAWNTARIPNTSASTLRAADRLTNAVNALTGMDGY